MVLFRTLTFALLGYLGMAIFVTTSNYNFWTTQIVNERRSSIINCMNNGEYHLLVFKVSMYMLSPNAIHAVSLVTFHREKL
jgi:hypothetical protein